MSIKLFDIASITLLCSILYSCNKEKKISSTTDQNNQKNTNDPNNTQTKTNDCSQENSYFIRSWDGKYLQTTSDFNKTGFLFSDTENKNPVCLEKNGTTVTIKINGKYLSANLYNSLLEVTTEPLIWENFKAEYNNDGGLRIKSHHNKYLITETKVPYLATTSSLKLSDDAKDHRSRFFLIKMPRVLKVEDKKCYYLRNKENIYVSTLKGDDQFYPSNKALESIYCINAQHGKLNIQSALDGKYITAANDQTVGKVDSASAWEYFIPTQLSNGAMSLKTIHNTFLTIDKSGKFGQTEKPLKEDEALFFEEADIIVNSTIGDWKNFGRFGNQIYQYLFLKTYALKKGLKVQTRSSDGDYFYDLKDQKASLLLPIASDMSWEPDTYNADLTSSYSDSSFPSFTGNDIRGYFLFHASKHIEDKVYIRSLFNVNPAISSKFENALTTLRKDGKKVLAIHIRRDDGVQTPLKLYVDFINNNYDKLGKPNIYIASDGLNKVMKELNDNYSDSLKNLTIFTENDFPEIIVSGKDSGHNYFSDFYMLTQADYLLTSVSTFSNAAAMLNERAEKNQTDTGIPSFYRPHTLQQKSGDYVADKLINFNPWNIYPARSDNYDN